jgi:AcrR family transcriptional regulator
MKEMTLTSAEVLGTADTHEPKRRGNRATRVPAIIEVAINVFATQGDAGFTQRRIAGDADIRLRTLQHYFGTREELLHATLEAFTLRTLERYRAIAGDKHKPPEARLDAFVDDAFSNLTGPASKVSAFVIEAWSLAERDEHVDAVMRKVTAQFQEIFTGLVASINPTLTSGECALRGALLLSQLQGLVVFIRRAGDNAPELESLRTATKVVWKALSTAA